LWIRIIESNIMSSAKQKAIAHPNIAFIKYWGNRDDALRLPVNGSISMNLDGLNTITSVEFQPQLKADSLTFNHNKISGPALTRVQQFLNLVRNMAGKTMHAEVISENNFPTGVGIASSASAFAALALAASRAIGLDLNESALSRLARQGSGSACRSVPGGFVEWLPGKNDMGSYAISLAAADAWDLVDCIAVVSTKHKVVGSTAGHPLAATSPLQAGRVQDAPRRLEICRRAILGRDFQAFADVVELDSNLMHAVMMTSSPPLFYWEPQSLEVMRLVRHWRAEGLSVCYTLDAGANVHVLCLEDPSNTIRQRLEKLDFVQRVITAKSGSGAMLVNP
jgi:diphosphomevalonate decarboxylase